MQWKEKEKELGKIFQEHITQSRQSLKELLKFYDTILQKYKNTEDPAEKISLLMLKQQRKKLNSKLYPDLASKTFELIRQTLVPLQKTEAIEQINFRNELRLKDQVIKAGFGNISDSFTRNIGTGAKEFTVSLSWHINIDSKIGYDLKFEKNSKEQYDFVQYTAKLFKGDDPKNFVRQTFTIAEGITPTQAYNLLDGRPIEYRYVSADGTEQRIWKQLDFTDRDQFGNYKTKSFFFQDASFDVAAEINSLKEHLGFVKPAAEQVIEGLKNGNQQHVTLSLNGTETVVFFKADPQNKMLRYFNEKHEPVTLMQLITKNGINITTAKAEIEQKIEQSKGLKM